MTVLAVIWTWPGHRSPLTPQDSLADSLREGLAFARGNRTFKTIAVGCSSFLFAAGALWGLLASLAQREYALSSGHYGALLMAYGLGAVGAGLSHTKICSRCTETAQLTGARALYGGALLSLALGQGFPAILITMLLAGAAWMVFVSQCHLAIQQCAPEALRGRATSLYLLCFFGSVTVGSLVWGLMADYVGLRATFGLAGLFLWLTGRGRLHGWLRRPGLPDAHAA